MEVVQKCYDIEVPSDSNLIGEITCELTKIDIGGTYEAVVNFINGITNKKQKTKMENKLIVGKEIMTSIEIV
jgi:hypothetical protein